MVTEHISCNPFADLESESRSKEGSGSRGSPGRLMGQGRGYEGALDAKNSTAPQKTLKKHVFFGLKKNTKKHQGAWGGGVDWDRRGGKRSRESGETREPCQP